MGEHKIPDYIPDKDDLEREFRKYNARGYIAITAMVVFNIYMLVLLYIFPAQPHYRAATTVLLFISFLVFSAPYLEMFRKKRVNLKNMDDGELVGLYSGREIKALVRETIEPEKYKEIPNVYLVYDKDYRAATVNSLAFNFIKPVNAIYFSILLFSILNKDELKALLAHELGHFSRYTLPTFNSRVVIFIFLGMFPAYFYYYIWNYSLLVALFTPFIALYIVNSWVSVFMAKSLEHLCDYYAAERYGKLNLINSLLTIAKVEEIRVMASEKILARVKDDDELSAADLKYYLDLLEKNLYDRELTGEQIDALIERVFESEDINARRSRLSEVKVKSEDGIIERFLNNVLGGRELKLLDWNEFDIESRDNKISEKEYPHLIRALIQNPDSQLFRLKIDNKSENDTGSHPTMAERILFLEKSGVN